jgi:hypothetical protein
MSPRPNAHNVKALVEQRRTILRTFVFTGSTVTGASRLDARPGRSPTGAPCRGRCRGRDAAGIQSADILSWWHFRIECFATRYLASLIILPVVLAFVLKLLLQPDLGLLDPVCSVCGVQPILAAIDVTAAQREGDVIVESASPEGK